MAPSHAYTCTHGLICYLFELFDYIMTWIRGVHEEKKSEKRRKQHSAMDKMIEQKVEAKGKAEVDVRDQKLVARKAKI